MAIKQTNLKSIGEIKTQILSGIPTLFHGSKTSTVIPFEKIEGSLKVDGDYVLANLGDIPGSLELENDILKVSGNITWKDAKEFCLANGRAILTSPTEELAAVLSGVATSCTGERCFGHGTLREQLVKVIYLDHLGESRELNSDVDIKTHEIFKENKDNLNMLAAYQKSYEHFKDFKNAPFPRLEKETDLMTGTEGQLGVITEAWLKTAPADEISYIFLKLPKWEEDYTLHLEVFEKVQAYRDVIVSCELIDSNAINYLPEEDQLSLGSDLIFLEVKTDALERVYNEFFLEMKSFSPEDFFEVPAVRTRRFRMNIPRYVFDENAKMGVVKKGTDVQVTPDKMKDLFDFYRSLTKKGVPFNLFGHFGDAHLHFNFMPTAAQADSCQEALVKLYEQVVEWKGSPFAEHGVGLLKMKFMGLFYSNIQLDMFKVLKQNMDPGNIFFPQGFLNIKETH